MNHILICTCEDSKCIRTQMVWRLNEWFQKINILRLEKKHVAIRCYFFLSLLFLSQQKMNPLNGSNLNPHICMHNSNCNFMRLFLIDDWNGKSPVVRPHEQASSVLNYAFCVFLSIFRKVHYNFDGEMEELGCKLCVTHWMNLEQMSQCGM